MTDEDGLLARVHRLLPEQTSAREVRMFGGRALMIRDAMVVHIRGDGELLVRADPARHDELLARPGAAPATMGAGREMGAGWVTVDAEELHDDRTLAWWVGVALEHNRRQSDPSGSS